MFIISRYFRTPGAYKNHSTIFRFALRKRTINNLTMKLKQVFFLLISIKLKGFHHRMVSMQFLSKMFKVFSLKCW